MDAADRSSLLRGCSLVRAGSYPPLLGPRPTRRRAVVGSRPLTVTAEPSCSVLPESQVLRDGATPAVCGEWGVSSHTLTDLYCPAPSRLQLSSLGGDKIGVPSEVRDSGTRICDAGPATLTVPHKLQESAGTRSYSASRTQASYFYPFIDPWSAVEALSLGEIGTSASHPRHIVVYCRP